MEEFYVLTDSQYEEVEYWKNMGFAVILSVFACLPFLIISDNLSIIWGLIDNA